MTVEDQAPAIPTERVLTDKQGRQIEARIIGRNLETLTIVRLSDSKQFELPIERLSPVDQTFAKELPLVAASPSKKPDVKVADTGPIVFKRARLEEINREISE
ncbi:MAG: hypothetical protein AAGC68_10780, partial [Verrucomicrobiota bacterium]